MQMRCQAEFAQSGLDLTLDSIGHWRKVADEFTSDCVEKLRAKESVAYFQGAAAIFADLLAACHHAERDAEAMIGR
jgi:hypothetical protein